MAILNDQLSGSVGSWPPIAPSSRATAYPLLPLTSQMFGSNGPMQLVIDRFDASILGVVILTQTKFIDTW